MNSPDLRTLSIGGTNVHATFGHFLPKVLDLKNLQHLELKSVMKDLQGVDAAHQQGRCAPTSFLQRKDMIIKQQCALHTHQ